MARNNSSRFILPMLADEISFRKNDVFELLNYIYFTRDSYVNTYIKDENKPEYEDKIFLKYQYDLLLDFPIFERKLEHLPTYITDYDVEDGIVYVFDIPNKYKDIYDSFKRGKYSEFTKEYKQHVMDFWNQDGSSPMAALFQNKKQRIENYLKDKRNITLEELNNPGELWFMPDEKEIIHG